MSATSLRRHVACLAVLVGIAAGPPAHAAALAERDEATAYALDSGRVLYRETHWRYTGADGAAERLVLYRCANGDAFARKHLTVRGVAAAPDFDFLDARSGRREGVRGDAGGREVYVQADAHAPLRSARLDAKAAPVIDAGFDAFVRAHWARLAPGRSLAAPFVVPSRLGTLPLRLESLREQVERGRTVRVMRLRLDSWLAIALPDVELAYDVAERRLQRYSGLGTVRSERGAPLSARIEFDSPIAAVALSGVQLRALRQAPLVTRCEP